MNATSTVATSTVQVQTRATEASTPVSNRYYVLVILSVIYGLNFLDRNIISILVEPIKSELHASDTAMGLLTGFAFAIMYATTGMPIARWADVGNRRNIITAGLTVWSVFTALTGMAGTFVHLALTRLGVGLGEAAAAPPSHSMISDYFPRELRARALAIFQASIYLGIGFGYIIGGWVNQFWGWRAAFWVAGIPGILVALVLRFTVREPRRGLYDHAAATAATRPRLGAVLSFMMAQKSYVLVIFALAVVGFSNYSMSVWGPSVLKRVYHLPTGQIGMYLGLIKAPAGLAGTLAGGFLAGRLQKRDQRWLLWFPAIPVALAFPFWLEFSLVNNLGISIMCVTIGSLLTGFQLGPCYALCQNLVKPSMRALSSAISFMLLTLLGNGMGPLAVGFLSDVLRPRFAAGSIRYAIASTSIACVAGAILMVIAAFFVRNDLARVES